MTRDPVTGEFALHGFTRAGRPNEFRDGPEQRCAFCPGNEDLTPPEIARAGGERQWDVRVFRNKYPAIVPPEGDHEVIVDSPRHDEEMTASGMEMWRERYRAALERMPSSFPVLFKNSGAFAGATIVHPHTQLIVLPSRPERWNAMLRSSEACVWCAQRANAEREKTIVAETGGATAFVRADARFAWALTVLPRICEPSIHDASERAWEATAELARTAATAVTRSFGAGAAFNVLPYSDPHAGTASFHWHIEVIPRFGTLAGFELSTGMFIRGAAAQESAEWWRRMIAPPDGSV